ncbi:MAG: response regulator [Chthonomonadales bacterium]|nr:response regulator [Chthonomonadales bacterium]
MGRPIRVLVVEDNPEDADLTVRALHRGGYAPAWQRVDTAEAMREALRVQSWDLALADYGIPGFGALPALRVLHESGLDIPCIVLSRTAGEETAVDVMRAGARDYVKKENLTRLVPAVERELREAQVRRERVSAEEALRESRELLQAVVNAAPVILFALDNAGTITFAEGRGLEALGRTQGELVGHSAFALYRGNEEVLAQVRGALAGERDHSVAPVPCAGRTFEMRWAAFRGRGGERLGTIGLAADITDRVELERELLHSQKMQALGTLAGGIAHDFNNLLQAILGHAELLRERKADEDPDVPSLSGIEEAAHRAARLISELLTFSRMQAINLRPIALHEVVRATAEHLERGLPSSVTLRLELGAARDRVVGDPDRLQQAMQNLCMNAREAMPDGGELLVETANRVVEPGEPGMVPEAEPGRYVVMSVQDSGPGMDPDMQRRVFDPFFTTKDVGKGTGLGLAIVYGVARSHSGFVQLVSEPGRGTRFSIYLPEAEPARPHAEPADEEARGSETVLVVEDESMLADLLRQMLERRGFLPLVAHGADEALALFEAHRESIALVVTDLVMPGRDGMELAQELHARDTALPILLATGYVADSDVAELQGWGIRGVIAKPYRAGDIVRKVREVLDARPES